MTLEKKRETFERQYKSQNSKELKNALKELEQTRKTAYKTYRIMGARLAKEPDSIFGERKIDSEDFQEMKQQDKLQKGKSNLGIG